jgi:transposase
MGQVTTIGLDIAKSVFDVHGIDAEGGVVLRRRLTRARMLPFFAKLEACKIGIEARATSHYWAQQLRTLGHDVRLMPPSYVKPYVKRQKNDTADSEAICEAVTRPTMRFVEVKTPEQQSILVLHRTRLMLMRPRIQLSNAIRGHMAEFGVIAPIGAQGPADADRSSQRRAGSTHGGGRPQLPDDAGRPIAAGEHPDCRDGPPDHGERTGDRCRPEADGHPGRRTASRQCPDRHHSGSARLRSGRNLAAWIGMVPKQNSSSGKERLGGIAKQGNRYLRQMLVVGALAVIRYAERHGTRRPWLVHLMTRRPAKVAAVALANKMARMVWAILTSGQPYREPMLQAA